MAAERHTVFLASTVLKGGRWEESFHMGGWTAAGNLPKLNNKTIEENEKEK